MTPILVEHNEGIMAYCPVVHDAKPERRKAIGKGGRAFGSIETCEAIPMSVGNARWQLAGMYGMEVAEGMLFRADQGDYVYGEKKDLGGYQGKGKIRGGMNVAADRSRPGNYVTQMVVFVQGGIKLWAATLRTTDTRSARTRSRPGATTPCSTASCGT
jgi:hypothetical protein